MPLLAILILGAQATPQDTVNNFVRFWNTKDLKAAAQLVVGGKPNADFREIKTESARWPAIAVSDVKATTRGVQATATFRISISVPTQAVLTRNESAELSKVNGKWLLVPTMQGQANPNYLPSMAALMANPSVFAQASQAAKQTTCLSNIKQLATGLLILASDHRDTFAVTASNVKAQLKPYVKNDRLWQCPLAPNQTAYSFNPALQNKREADIREPAKTVLIYEGAKGKLAFRHAGRAAVGFADGHAKLIRATEASNLVWKP